MARCPSPNAARRPVGRFEAIAPSTAPDEADRSLLLAHLSAVRRHVLTQLEGLDDDQLRRPVLPSGWSSLGLVRHLTLSDERYWFAVVVAGDALDFWPEEPNGDWLVGTDESSASVLDAYRAAIDHADRVIDERSLDTPPRQPEAWWSEAGLDFPTLRSVIMHVIVETATHAGQLDAVRELLDGRQHVVL